MAPDEIAPDVAALREEFQQQADAMGGTAANPLGGLAAGLLGSVSVSGSYQRVDEYTAEHCGPPPGD